MLFCIVVITGVESVWSGVVSGTQAAVLPAYRPSFQPIPLLHSASNVDVVRPSTPTSKHFQQGSPLSSSSQLSHEDVSSEQDVNSCVRGPSNLYPATDSTLHREESRDSGAILVTPPRSSSPVGPNLGPEFNISCRNSSSPSTDLPTMSLVNVGRKLFGRLSDNGEVEYRRKDLATGFVSRKSLPGDVQIITDEACEQSADDLPDALLLRRTSCCGVLYHRSDEEFVTPSKTKKKTKKSRRGSQPGQASCSSTKSMAVYGGNPKWIWKS